MDGDDFERRLRSQRLSELPKEWRSAILTAAEAARTKPHHSAGWRFTHLETLRSQVVALLWPSPKIWAGLAAIWLCLAGANRAMLNQAETRTGAGPRPAAAMIEAWKEQERVLAELIQPAETAQAESRRPATPGPRSEISISLRMI